MPYSRHDACIFFSWPPADLLGLGVFFSERTPKALSDGVISAFVLLYCNYVMSWSSSSVVLVFAAVKSACFTKVFGSSGPFLPTTLQVFLFFLFCMASSSFTCAALFYVPGLLQHEHRLSCGNTTCWILFSTSTQVTQCSLSFFFFLDCYFQLSFWLSMNDFGHHHHQLPGWS